MSTPKFTVHACTSGAPSHWKHTEAEARAYAAKLSRRKISGRLGQGDTYDYAVWVREAETSHLIARYHLGEVIAVHI